MQTKIIKFENKSLGIKSKILYKNGSRLLSQGYVSKFKILPVFMVQGCMRHHDYHSLCRRKIFEKAKSLKPQNTNPLIENRVKLFSFSKRSISLYVLILMKLITLDVKIFFFAIIHCLINYFLLSKSNAFIYLSLNTLKRKKSAISLLN